MTERFVIPQGYPLWITYYESPAQMGDDVRNWTDQELEDFTSTSEQEVRDEWLNGPHLVVGWRYAYGGVPQPISRGVGECNGHEFIGLTPQESVDQATKYVTLLQRELREMPRRAPQQ